jgi:hypothetical protein
MKQLAVPFGNGKWPVTVVLTVPRTWLLSRTQPESCCLTPPTRCVVEAGSDYANNARNCRLTVTYSPGLSQLSPNVPAPAGLPEQSCHSWSTAQESNWTIAGREGEYRRFVNTCSGAESEQWTIMTGPQIAFWHAITAPSDHPLLAGIVSSAVLPPQTDPRRQYDVGYVRQISKRTDGYHLRLDRVVQNLDGTVINVNPATYDYRLSSPVDISKPTLDRCDHWENLTCTMSYLLSQFPKGPHPTDGSLAVDGAYVDLMNQAYRTAPQYRVRFTEPTRYEPAR